MKERNKTVPASYLILKNEQGEILLMLRQNTGYMDGMWSAVSGHVERGESPKQGMMREAQEEVGITLKPADLTFVHAMHRVKHDETGDRSDYFFEATNWSGEVVNAEPDKCSELQWFDPKNLPENMIPHIGYGIAAVARGEEYSELNEVWHKEKGLWQLA